MENRCLWKPGRRSAPLGLGCIVAVALAGCGAGKTNAQQATAVQVASCVKAANSLLRQYTAPLRFILPGPSFNMAANKGKTVWDISPNISNQIQSGVAQGVQAAGAAAGLTVHVWDGNNSVPTEEQGVSEAVAQHASGIILQSVEASLISGPLAAATAAHIPVVQWDDNDPGTPLDGVSARVTSNFFRDGEAMGAYVLVHSNCNADALVLYPSAFPNNVDIWHGFAGEVGKYCKSCDVIAVAINPATAATVVGPEVQTYIRQNPKLKWVVPTYDDLASTVVVPAIQAMGSAGASVHVVSHDGNTANLALIRSKTVQVADIAFPPSQYQGWVMIDQIGRLMAGVAPGSDLVPTTLVDTSNIPSSNAALYRDFGNYQAAFKKLWKLG